MFDVLLKQGTKNTAIPVIFQKKITLKILLNKEEGSSRFGKEDDFSRFGVQFSFSKEFCFGFLDLASINILLIALSFKYFKKLF